MAIDIERAVTPAKRKLDARNLSPHELEHKEARPPPGQVNGDHVPSRIEEAPVKKEPGSASIKKKRVHRKQPPVWAQSAKILGKQLPKNDNFVLQKRVHSHINGAKSEGQPDSRHATPEKSKPRASQPAVAVAVPETGPQDLLGSWEPSLTGVRPYEEVSRMVADFLFVHVVNSEDMREITSRGIKFEVEAKLGTLIDKDTNQRVERGIESEGILSDTGRTAFRSSMTEVSDFSCILFTLWISILLASSSLTTTTRAITRPSTISSTRPSSRPIPEVAPVASKYNTSTVASWTDSSIYQPSSSSAYLAACDRALARGLGTSASA